MAQFTGEQSELTQESLAVYAAQLRHIALMLESTSDLMKDCKLASVIASNQKSAQLGIKNLGNFQVAVTKAVREVSMPMLSNNASATQQAPETKENQSQPGTE